MSFAENTSILHQALSEECEMAMTLVDVLSDEQSCLIRLESARLIELALKKESLMLELERRFKQRLKEAQQLGFGEDYDALVLWVKDAGRKDTRIPFLFSTFQNTVAQAQRLNDLNGALVAEQLASLQTRIQILTESSRPVSAGVYGPDGAYGGGTVVSLPKVIVR